ncbi:hypothetical protein BOTBODRAFT_383952 [Botryobasidium botryosum FD-172 SS1]|uniref:Uncharacterized protein n=1 Tax=Botryobasidium botryosum (strain FD-172 SS1) TaxID=930990 RepID=A0A067MWL8_BOTB1|nr:hypothetical protein BOTBODRAFT_383952 [Botryobasidium botryosum FD-172 SS1]
MVKLGLPQFIRRCTESAQPSSTRFRFATEISDTQLEAIAVWSIVSTPIKRHSWLPPKLFKRAYTLRFSVPRRVEPSAVMWTRRTGSLLQWCFGIQSSAPRFRISLPFFSVLLCLQSTCLSLRKGSVKVQCQRTPFARVFIRHSLFPPPHLR